MLAISLAAETTGSARAAPSVRVFPSAVTVSQRLLRISLFFASPQDDSIANDARIRAQDGTFAFHPFADPPLWSPDHKTLTLLLDPSRQKLGLADHRAYGFVLGARQRAQLLLGSRVVKTWDVTEGSCPTLDPARWVVAPVRAGSREPLTVRFPAPIDILSRNFVAVAAPDGTRVVGTGRLEGFERTWSFVPAVAWRLGDRLAVHPRLENPCGDEVGEPFEHASGGGLGSDRKTTFIPLKIAKAAADGS